MPPRFLALVFALSLAPSFAATSATQPPRTTRWDRFELSVANPKRYADPFRDVTLEAVYSGPRGRRIVFQGFYDGGQTWRLRFMPDIVGSWRYEAKFSDGSPGASGSFECVEGKLPGLISVYAANPIWFGFKGGTSTLVRGLHVADRFFARNWDDPNDPADGNKRTTFLDWFQAQGYNTLTVASHYLNRNTKGRGQGWDTPALWPLNVAAYQGMERILDDLARRGINVYPFAGFFGRDSNFPRDPADQELYVRYTIARLGAYRNLLFNVGGPEPRLRGKPFLSVDDINRLGGLISAHDPFGHALTVHNPTGNDEFKDATWHSFGTLQGPKTTDRRRLADGLLRNHHAAKPLLAQETLWSGNTFHIRSNKGDYTDADLRKNAFVIHFSAANAIFADNNGDSSSGFTGTLDLADRRQSRHDILKHAWDTFATLPFARTKPAPELIATADVNVFCLANPAHDYLLYFETPGKAQLRLASGSYRAEWINAQDSRDRLRNRVRAGEAESEFVSPREGDDWILHLSRVEPQ